MKNMNVVCVLSLLTVGLTAPLASAAGFSIGEEVLPDNGISAHVISVDGDKITIQWDGQYGRTLKPFTVSSAEIAHTSGGNGVYSVGDAIVSEPGVAGKVIGLFDDGQLEVRFIGATMAAKMDNSELAATTGKIGNIEVGQGVLDARGMCAKVIGVYPNQDAEVRWSGLNRAFRSSLDKFKPESNCK